MSFHPKPIILLVLSAVSFTAGQNPEYNVLVSHSSPYLKIYTYDYNSNTWNGPVSQHTAGAPDHIRTAYDNESNTVVCVTKSGQNDYLAVDLYNLSSNSWSTGSNLNFNYVGNYDIAYDKENDRIVLICIATPGSGTYSYDLNSDNWEEKAGHPVGSDHLLNMTYDDNKDSIVVTVYPGGNDNVSSHAYDLNTDSWSTRAGFNSGPITSMDVSFDRESNRIILTEYYDDYLTPHSYNSDLNQWFEHASVNVSGFSKIYCAQDIESDRMILLNYDRPSGSITTSSYNFNTDVWQAEQGISIDTYAEIDLLYAGNEYSGPVWYVSTAGSDSTGDGSVTNPFASIQTGIDNSNDGDTVLVSPGTYFESINFNGKALIVGSQFIITGDTSTISETTIDGNFAFGVVSFISGEDSNSALVGLKVVNADTRSILCENSDPVISDCIITQNIPSSSCGIWCENSNATIKSVKFIDNGGGICMFQSNPVITNSIISGNNGSGISCNIGSSPIIEHSVISGNSVTAGGGGIFINDSYPIIRNVIIRNNSAGGNGGGGVHCSGSSNVTLDSVRIISNSTYTEGGGIKVRDGCTITISRSEITGNSADLGGGGIYGSKGSDIIITNSTICDNSTINNGSGLYMQAHYSSHSSAQIKNSIIWNNSIFMESYSHLGITYSDLQGGSSSVGGDTTNLSHSFLINADPLFYNAISGDYSLSAGSPCIDAGDPDPQYNDPDGTRNDLGAYYFSHSSIPDSVNYSIYFDGIDDYIGNSTLDFSQLDGNITVEGILKVQDSSGYHVILRNGESQAKISLYISSGFLWFLCGDYHQGHPNTNDYPLNEWFHFAGTWDGTTSKIYINGVLKNLSSNSGPQLSEGYTYWGGSPVFGWWYNGYMDEFRIWNRALTQYEIQSLMFQAVDTSQYSNMYLYYNCNEGVGNIVYDQSGSGHIGILYGPNWNEDVPGLVTTPDAPRNLRVDPGNQSATLSWNYTQDTQVIQFYIFRDLTSPATILIDSIENTLFEAVYTDSGLTNGQIYCYQITAMDSNGLVSGFSNVVNVIPYNHNNFYSLYFDGYDDYVEIPDDSSLDFTYFTIEAWVRYNSDMTRGTIIDKRQGTNNDNYTNYYLGVLPIDNSTSFFISNGSSYNEALWNQVPSAGEWHHLAGTFDGTELRLYVDGTIRATQLSTMIPLTNTYSMTIGWDFGYNRAFDGYIDEVRLWDRALTTDEIQTKMTQQLDYHQETGLVGYWKFDEGTGSFLNDLSINNNTGIIHGSAWNTFSPFIYDGPIFHVATTGSDVFGNGTITNPFASIQAGLDHADSGETIIVHSGTYYENIAFGNKNVILYSAQGPDSTIIDGLNNDRVLSSFGNMIDSTTIINGFTIRNGYSGPASNGGGIYIQAASPKIVNCIIRDNTCQGSGTSGFGGGIYAINSSIIIDSCIFTNNNGNDGGAICLRSDINSKILNSQFYNNISGSGNSIEILYNSDGHQVIYNCNFSDEENFIEMDMAYADSVSIINSNFSNCNYRAINTHGLSYLLIKDCNFNNINNTIDNVGAAIKSDVTYLRIEKTFFNKCENLLGLGAVLYTDSPTNEFVQNIVVNCPNPGINNNQALIVMGSAQDLQINSSILWCAELDSWNNYFEGSGNVDVAYSNINVNLPNGVGLLGNIWSNPFFCDIYNNEYTVAANSPVIGAGYNGVNIGNAIVGCDSVNIGPTWIISTAGSDTSGTGSFAQPFHTINHAIMFYALDGDTIILLDGIYNENIAISNKELFMTSLFYTDQEQNHIYSTTLNGMNNDHTIEIWYGENKTVTLSGLTIQNGQSIWGAGAVSAHANNIGILNIKYCIVKNSSGAQGGGIGVFAIDSLIVDHCIIFDNNSEAGGGLYTESNKTTVINSTITSNSCIGNGAELNINGSTTAVILNSIIWNPYLHEELYTNSSTGALVDMNYSILGNLSEWTGLGIGNIDLNPLFIDTLSHDFNLQWGSPAIDSGDPNSPLDPDSTRADMGALYYDQTDTIPPTAIFLSPSAGSQFGTEDTILIEWQARDTRFLSWAKLYYSYNPDSIFIFIDSLDANNGLYYWAVPDSNISNSCRFIIEISDHWNNIITDTSDYFTIFDNTVPVLQIYTPNQFTRVREYLNIEVNWNASDNIGLDSTIIYYSNNTGESEIIAGYVLGDSTSYSFPAPAGVTDSAYVRIEVRDLNQNIKNDTSSYFHILDNTPPLVSLSNPSSGTELAIGSALLINWTTNDNVGVTRIELQYTVDNAHSWLVISDNLGDYGSFNWIVPNNPSDSVGLRIIAEDEALLSDTAEVMGLSIIVVYPIVTSISPDILHPISWLEHELQVQVVFSQIMQPTGISIDFSTISGFYDAYSWSFGTEPDSTLSIHFPYNIPAGDTFSISIGGSNFTNTLGYQFDGDSDGLPGGYFTARYSTLMYADYDTSGSIDVIDLARFIQALEHDEYQYELGPFLGQIPNVTLHPDNKFDIEDVMAFVMMWNWYIVNQGFIFTEFKPAGESIGITAYSDSIALVLPDGIAWELQIKYAPETINILDSPSDSEIQMKYNDEKSGFFHFVAAVTENKLTVPIKMSVKETDIKLSVKVVAQSYQIIGQRTDEIHLINLPTEFCLHQNYPNPFNPFTTIEYDIPEETPVCIKIFDILGREIITLIDENQLPGYHQLVWDGLNKNQQNVSSGIYLYTMQAGKHTKMKKMVVLK